MRPDPFAAARSVADTVLYEGYVLYPYRASAHKNQFRWQFGVLVPGPCADVDGPERAFNRTEVIVVPGVEPVLDLRARCLQVQRRSMEAAVADGGFVAAESVEVDGTPLSAWDEALDHEIDVSGVALRSLVDNPRTIPFELAGCDSGELLYDAAGSMVGRVRRHAEPVSGSVILEAVWAKAGLDEEPTDILRVSVRVTNLTPWPPAGSEQSENRETVMRYSLVAVHTVLAIQDGTFISSVDPPAEYRQAVADCSNEGTFPVLVGGMSTSQSERLVLASPIVLYDHPAIARESEGDLCDATEIDEILALRVLTLTDEEKSEARATDPRSAAIVDRCSSMSPDAWSRLHGTFRPIGEELAPELDNRGPGGPDRTGVPGAFDLPPFPVWEGTGTPAQPAPGEGKIAAPWWDPSVDRAVDPWTDTVMILGVEVAKGTKVRLAPSRRADAHDLFTSGMVATVAGVFTDVDGDQHVAVILDDDPANDLYVWQGRFLYFATDEIIPVHDDGVER
jgi:hypothetical protein